MIHARNGLEGVGYPHDAPAYTSSLDAAKTLVPEGWCYQIRFDPRQSGATVLRQDGFDQHHTVAANEALALTAACLRATVLRDSAHD
jgi:hypothetical protein